MEHITQTKASLRFAADARCVRNNAAVNSVVFGSNHALQAQLAELHGLVQRLTDDNRAWV